MVLKTEYDRLKHVAKDPASLLAELNRTLYAVYPGLEMRCSACCFDVEPHEGGTATVRYANAAHPPLLHVTNGKAREVYQPGPFLAMVEEIVLVAHAFELERGERLLAYTDGILEQEAATGEAFGIDRVAESISDRQRPLGDALRLLVTRLDQFRGELPLSDDATLVAAECPP